MEFFQNIFNVISSSEAFLIVVSGVFIFSTQQLISQIWIEPIKEFKRCKAKIETLLNRWDFLHRYTEGRNPSLNDANGTMDERIVMFRRELNDIVTELIYVYNNLPVLEKWYLLMSGVDVKTAKTSLLSLSVLIAKDGDWASGESKSAIEINKVYSTLKLSRYLQSPF